MCVASICGIRVHGGEHAGVKKCFGDDVVECIVSTDCALRGAGDLLAIYSRSKEESVCLQSTFCEGQMPSWRP